MDSKDKNIVDFGVARKNLRQKAKQQARDEKEKRAEENRIRFGRTGAQKKQDRLEKARKEKRLNEHSRKSKETEKDKDHKNDR
jgi:uncharacterized protein DUF4169